jgi:predicted ATPase
MEFYDPDPRGMKIVLDSSSRAGVLDANGGNAASVLSRIEAGDQWAKIRIEEYMRRILPGISSVETVDFQSRKYLNFVQNVGGTLKHDFTVNSISDGTLRALAILIALFQRGQGSSAPSLVAIEEPETGIHPAAAGILLDSFIERSNFVQVLVTSHSPDLLDNKHVPPDSILSVENSSGSTRIGRLDKAGRSTLQERLYTAGELLRMNALHPEAQAIENSPTEPALFDHA